MAKPKRNPHAVVGFVVWKGPAVVGVKAAKDKVTQHRGARRDAAPIAERPQQDDLLSDVVGVEPDLAAGAPRRQKHPKLPARPSRSAGDRRKLESINSP